MSQRQCEICKGVGLVKSIHHCNCASKCVKCEGRRRHGNYTECAKCAGIGVIHLTAKGERNGRENFL